MTFAGWLTIVLFAVVLTVLAFRRFRPI